MAQAHIQSPVSAVDNLVRLHLDERLQLHKLLRLEEEEANP
jgi:hypothetical protein